MNKLEQFAKVSEYVFLTDNFGALKKVVFPLAIITSMDLGCRWITGNPIYSYLGANFPAEVDASIYSKELSVFGLSLIYIGANGIKNCMDIKSPIK